MMRRAAVAGILVACVLVACGSRPADPPPAAAGSATKRVLYYVDPMHPAYKSDKPGKAPDCGMDLEPVYADASAAAGPSAGGAVAISPERQQLFGIRVETVERRPEARLVRATGRVAVAGDRLWRVMVGADGIVESVGNNPPGTRVRRDEPLATLFSREFRNAQQAYLGSLTSVERTQGKDDASDGTAKANLTGLEINEEQLRGLGMSPAQIRQLARTRKITSEITLNAPADGIVLSRTISPGQRFSEGQEFYRIADLSRVWITADVVGDDATLFRSGTKASVAVRESPTRIDAVVSKSPPYFDPDTRTLRVRLEAANPGLALRPEMFVDVELAVPAAPAVTVPIEALVESGHSETVFVERREGEFEPRPVVTGWRSAERVEIVGGLAPGERVVTAGTFLVDSESRLRVSGGP